MLSNTKKIQESLNDELYNVSPLIYQLNLQDIHKQAIITAAKTILRDINTIHGYEVDEIFDTMKEIIMSNVYLYVQRSMNLKILKGIKKQFGKFAITIPAHRNIEKGIQTAQTHTDSHYSKKIRKGYKKTRRDIKKKAVTRFCDKSKITGDFGRLGVDGNAFEKAIDEHDELKNDSPPNFDIFKIDNFSKESNAADIETQYGTCAKNTLEQIHMTEIVNKKFIALLKENPKISLSIKKEDSEFKIFEIDCLKMFTTCALVRYNDGQYSYLKNGKLKTWMLLLDFEVPETSPNYLEKKVPVSWILFTDERQTITIELFVTTIMFQGNTIGRQLLLSLIETYRDRRIIVNASNQEALINYYKTFGFTKAKKEIKSQYSIDSIPMELTDPPKEIEPFQSCIYHKTSENEKENIPHLVKDTLYVKLLVSYSLFYYASDRLVTSFANKIYNHTRKIFTNKRFEKCSALLKSEFYDIIELAYRRVLIPFRRTTISQDMVITINDIEIPDILKDKFTEPEQRQTTARLRKQQEIHILMSEFFKKKVLSNLKKTKKH